MFQFVLNHKVFEYNYNPIEADSNHTKIDNYYFYTDQNCIGVGKDQIVDGSSQIEADIDFFERMVGMHLLKGELKIVVVFCKFLSMATLKI